MQADPLVQVINVPGRFEDRTGVLPSGPVAGVAVVLAALGAAGIAGCTGSDSASSLAPPPGETPLFTFSATFPGSSHHCALANSSLGMCWGDNRGGQLGNGTTEASETPVRVQGAHAFARLSAASFTCGITTNGVAFCWGSNIRGRLGDGTTEPRLIPEAVATNLRFTDIVAGGVHACALADDGGAHCWGNNQNGELGGWAEDTVSLVPVSVIGGHRFRSLGARSGTTCGLTPDGEVLCWGVSWGASPRPLSGAPAFERISLGNNHSCGLTAEGEAFCWGENDHGELGDGTTESTPFDGPPVAVDTELRFTDIAAGGRHTCAIAADERVRCWGSDDVGQLGDSDTPSVQEPDFKPRPSEVQTDRRFVSIAVGRALSCGISDRAEAWCWGWTTGNPSNPRSTKPVRIGS